MVGNVGQDLVEVPGGREDDALAEYIATAVGQCQI